MTRLFLIICTAALPLLAFADDQIKWGEPVNGLRIGIVNPPTTVTSDQHVTLKIEAQNVSQQPIILPTRETFVLKRNPQSDDYHESPLVPVVEKTRFAPRSDQPESEWSMSASGVIVDKAHEGVVSLAPGQSVTWESVGLEKQYYYGDRLQAGSKATVQRWSVLPGYLFHIRFRFENEEKRFAGKSVWIGQADSGVTDVKVDAPSTAGIKLEGGFSLPKQKYFLGEAIQATFAVTNKGDTSIRFLTGGDYSYSGRHGRYSIRAVDEQGQVVPDPVANPGGGGIGSDALVEPGSTYTENMLVNQWCAFSKPGKYRITFKRTLNVIRPDPQEPDFYRKPESSLPAVTLETTLDVTIEDNPSALKAYLAALSNIVGLTSASSGSNPASGPTFDLLKSEAQARMPAAFPEIVKLLDGPPEIQLQAVQCLAYYGSEKAAPVLLEHAAKLAPWAHESALRTLSEWNATGVEPLVAAALRDNDNELRANTVLICSNKWYGSCVPILLTMGNDPDPLVRRYLGAALGASGNPQAIPVLLKLLHDSDPDPYIKIWAAEGLGKFKRMDGVPVMIALLRDPKVRGDEGNVMQTLKDLTSQDFSDNRNAYLDWWEKTGRGEYEKH
jgi:HEAT repeat protein